MALPYSILKELWHAGYAGKVVRVPPKSERMMMKIYSDEILCEAEEIYEKGGRNFVLEKRGRSDFYRFFGVLRLCRRFHLEIKDARRVRRRAYWRWFRWMRLWEEPRLKAIEKMVEDGEARVKYLRARRRIRLGEGPDGNESQEFVRMAGESVRGVTWR